MSVTCCFCGAENATVSEQKEEFQYNDGEKLISLHAHVNVTHCDVCNLSSTDCEGEDRRAAAVEAYKNSLNTEDMEIFDILGPNYAELEAQIEILKAALKPFADAIEALDVTPAGDGTYYWGGREQNQRISTWFGPTDFGKAAEALKEVS